MKHATVSPGSNPYHVKQFAERLGKNSLIHGGHYLAYRLAAALGSDDPLVRQFLGSNTQLPLIPAFLDAVSVYGKSSGYSANGVFTVNGVTIEIPDFAFMRPSADLYAVGQKVPVLICAPTRAGKAVEINVSLNGNMIQTEKVQINVEGGIAMLRLHHLAPGKYSLTFVDTALGELGYEFIVADFTLAMLSFKEVQPTRLPDDNAIRVSGKLMRPGDDPLATTKVKFELMEKRRRRDTVFATTDEEGAFTVELQLDGATRSLSVLAQVQQQGGSDLTAEYRLPGSSQAERTVTPVTSFMGQMYGVSLMSTSPEAQDVNKMYIVPMELTNSIITPQTIIGKEVTLLVQADVPVLSVTVFDPFRKKYETVEHRNLTPDSTITVTVFSLWNVVLMCGWAVQNGQMVPFSAYTSTFQHSELEVLLDMPPVLQPNEKFEMRITTNRPLTKLSVALFGIDVRLTHTCAMHRAAQALKDRIDTLGKFLGDSQPGGYTLADALASVPDPDAAFRRPRGGHLGGTPEMWEPRREPQRETPRWGSLGGPAPQEDSLIYGSRSTSSSSSSNNPDWGSSEILGADIDGAKSPLESSVDTTTRPDQIVVEDIREAPPSTFFEGGRLVFGEYVEKFTAPTDIGEYLFTAFCFDMETMQWAEHELRFTVTQPVYAKAIVPTYIPVGGAYRLRVLVATREGSAQVEVRYNNEVLPVTDIAGRELDSMNLRTPHDYFVILRGPGLLDITVHDPATGASDRSQYTIHAPDQIKTRYTRRMLLPPNTAITAQQLGAIIMWAEAGLDLTVNVLTAGLMGFEGRCCQQTSEELLASVHNIIASERSGSSINYFLRVSAYMRRMLPAEGHRYYGDIMFYPDYAPHQYYSLAAAWNLYHLDMYTQKEFKGVFPEEVASEIIALRNKGKNYLYRRGLIQADGRPVQITCGRDLHTAIQHGISRQDTLVFIGRYLVKEGDTYRIDGALPTYAHGQTVIRAELAYIAACMVMWQMWETAIPLASFVLGQVREKGLAHSSADTLPILLMVSAFQANEFGQHDTMVVRNGGRVMLRTLLADEDTFQSVETGGEPMVIGYTVDEVRSWNDKQFTKPVKVGLLNRDGEYARMLPVGQRATLRVSLPEGYVAGDMLRIVTPANLVMTAGGGQIQGMDIDFENKDTVDVELMAIAPTVEGTQDQIYVLVWNMFDEDKVGSPGAFPMVVTRR